MKLIMRKGGVFNLVGGFFLVFGLVFAAIGAVFYLNDRELAETGARARGIVIELVRTRGSSQRSGRDDFVYNPVVQFSDASGEVHEFTSSFGSRPAAFSRGEEVQVIYDPLRPQEAMIDSFGSRFMFPLMFCGMGLLFAAVGGGILLVSRRRKRAVARLRQSGRPIKAEFTGVHLDTGITFNGRNPYRVHCQAINPETGKLQSFESDPLKVDPGALLEGRKIRVLIDPRNARNYWVDLSDYVSDEERF